MVVTGHDDGSEMLQFRFTDGTRYKMWHEQSCCESVWLEEVHGDVADLIGHPLLMAEEVTEQRDLEDGSSETWSFYKFATVKGYVTLRWYGSSNGSYSEEVDVAEVDWEYTG